MKQTVFAYVLLYDMHLINNALLRTAVTASTVDPLTLTACPTICTSPTQHTSIMYMSPSCMTASQ